MHITITGMLGSGKSTICGIIRDNYGFEIFSTGAILREIALKENIPLLEINKRMGSDPSIDKMIDDTSARISRERPDDKLIFDSRMAWHFVEKSFKIFLTVKPEIAAARVMLNPRGKEEQYADAEEACKKLVERSAVENQRFKKFYGVDYYDCNNYDIVIDTSERTPEDIVGIIMDSYSEFCGNPEKYVKKTV